jgi:type IV pilus assembly protein PilA
MLSPMNVQDAKREEGFTLIELLVVVIIIGILAAIAIPVFLAQRERAWRSTVQSDLRNIAVSMETYYTDEGEYSAAALTDGSFGYQQSNGVEDRVVVVSDGGTTAAGEAYCVQLSHENLNETWRIGTGLTLEEAACPAASAL